MYKIYNDDCLNVMNEINCDGGGRLDSYRPALYD